VVATEPPLQLVLVGPSQTPTTEQFYLRQENGNQILLDINLLL